MSALNYSIPCSLAIGLGANLPSPAGAPTTTLIKIRPLLEKLICEWIKSLSVIEIDTYKIKKEVKWFWSPLYETEAIGGPNNQPCFINAVLLINGGPLLKQKPSRREALNLLKRLLKLEKQFGRDRKNSFVKWGPRSLDIDLLWWGALQLDEETLILPHPRLIERNFVITPLAEALSKNGQKISRLPGQSGWEE